MKVWDIGDPEPRLVTLVDDGTGNDDQDSPLWAKTVVHGEWKGYKNGGKVYLTWTELVRRWGPVKEASR